MVARSAKARLARLTVLVVEDHDDSREVLADLLEHEGAVVLSAPDGLAALEILAARTPDVILADLHMPRLDGLGLARRVKADARWARVPIVAVTALNSPADVHATFEAGFAAHVAKPPDWEVLIRTISRILPDGPPRRRH